MVEAAQTVIASLGLRGATVRAIAAEAGVSTGYVMHYFPDKQAVADAVLALTNSRASARVVAAVGRLRGLEALAAAVEAVLPLDGERRLSWQVWTAFWSAGSGGGLSGARKGLVAMFEGPLAEAVEDGELPAGLDLTYEAERLVTLAAGLGLMAGVGPATRTRRLAVRMLHDHLATLDRSAVPA